MAKTFKHWIFNNYINSLSTDDTSNKLDLINCIVPDVYYYIIKWDNYKGPLKTQRDIHSSHSHHTHECSETLNQILIGTETLVKECNFKAEMSEQYKSESIWDAFINGRS